MIDSIFHDQQYDIVAISLVIRRIISGSCGSCTPITFADILSSPEVNIHVVYSGIEMVCASNTLHGLACHMLRRNTTQACLLLSYNYLVIHAGIRYVESTIVSYVRSGSSLTHDTFARVLSFD